MLKKTIFKDMKKRASNAKRYIPISQKFGSRPVVLARMAETKQADLPTTTTVISTTFAASSLNDLVQGTDVCNRIGRSVRMKSCTVRATITRTANAIASDYLRIVLVYDREGDSGGIAWADIFQNISTAAATSSDVFSFANSGNWDRFKILKDLKFPMATGLAVSDDVTNYSQDMNVNFHVKLNGLEARYVAGSNVPSSGRLILCFLGANAVASAPFQCVHNARVTYNDV